MNLVRDATAVPAGWVWYRLLCVLMALINLCIAGMGAFLVRSQEFLASQTRNDPIPPEFWSQQGWILISMGAIFGPLNIALMFLPRRPWTYMAHLGNIIASILFVCPAPIAIPVLVMWIQPETRDYFDLK
jgi:cell division protein FtsW (lipid II flippase)